MTQTTLDTIIDPARLTLLQHTELLDSPPEEAFDRFTRLASQLLHVPVALVSLVDKDRQFFKSAAGHGKLVRSSSAPLQVMVAFSPGPGLQYGSRARGVPGEARGVCPAQKC